MFGWNDDRKDPMDGEYIGNIWGWKFSLIGLAMIVVLLAFMVYRHYTMGVGFGDPVKESTEVPIDTIQ